MKTHLSPMEKQHLFDWGYVIIRGAVAPEAINTARKLIENYLPKDERQLLVPGALATHEQITGLYSNHAMAQIIRNEMGPSPPVISCQIAVIPPYNKLGGEPGLHVDGGWSGHIPDLANDIDIETGRPKDATRYFGEHDETRGTNDGLLWMNQEKTLSYGSYTALVGIAINDQLSPGNGQFAVLPGTHEVVEQCFREQRDTGGVVGPEGSGWPRIGISKKGKPYCNGLPDRIREIAEQRRTAGTKTDQWPWPELESVLLKAGDAVLSLHSCPHTPTPNLGPNSRMSIYFRIRRLRENNPNEGTRRVAHGVSDHPDRGYFGQFLEYPDDYDPWQTSINKLCDHWSEWDGMQDFISTRTNDNEQINV